MRRVLVLGKTGMLGQTVLQTLSQDAALQVEGTHRLSSSDPLYFDAETAGSRLREVMARWGRYDVVINCIGILQSDINEQDTNSVRRAIRVNALFPHELAAVAAEQGSRVILVSTDGVFSGAGGPYFEDAQSDCTDLYGKTKSLGEVRHPSALTIRCSLIGCDLLKKRGLLEWFLAQPDGAQLQGYTDYLWNGVTTLQFAQMCRQLICQDRFDEVLSGGSVHHFCPNKPVSKFELLSIFKTAFHKDVRIMPTRCSEVPIRRVLASRSKWLGKLLDHDGEIATAVKQLADAHTLQLVK